MATQDKRDAIEEFDQILDDKDAQIEQLKGQAARVTHQSDVLKVQNGLRQLLKDPNADPHEIRVCRNWLSRHGPRSSEPTLTPRQRGIRTWFGNGFTEPKPRKHKGGLLGFLERLQ